jgi:pyruvate, water dikinase
VPGGFATTADAFRDFIAHNDLHQRIFDRLARSMSRTSRP